MKLYLAVAVLMLAFVAYTDTEAQDAEQTVEQRFNRFGEQVAEVSKGLAEKAKTTFEEISTSQFAEDTRNWFQTQFESLKAKLSPLTS
uniref:Apolipoprotein C-I n=1 Tax=Gasterosteus aculeatus TaxID=69293 RepID=G3NGS3_GASAC